MSASADNQYPATNLFNEAELTEDEEEGHCDHEPGLEFDDSELEPTPDVTKSSRKMNGNKQQLTTLDDEEESYRRMSHVIATSPPLVLPILEAFGPAGADSVKGAAAYHLPSPTDSLLSDENFEEAFAEATEMGNSNKNGLASYLFNRQSTNNSVDEEDDMDLDFTDIAKHEIVEVVGDDSYGRKVITIYASRLPPSKELNHNRLLKYLMYTLDQYVENDYIIVYFHHGLNSKNKPSLGWLWSAYRAFDRKYKKNLKNLYLVHPTSFIRIVWGMFKPLISAKFGKKMLYVLTLAELKPHLHLEQLLIPKEVIEHDKKLIDSQKNKKSGWFSSIASPTSSSPPLDNSAVLFHEKLATQQFRVSLKFIKEHSENGDLIPRVVRACVTYLDNETALQTEGIFRRSASLRTMKDIQELFNDGQTVRFEDYEGEQSIHLAAALLKSFLRELEEPILTFDLYDDVLDFQQIGGGSHSNIEKLAIAKSMVLQRLPEHNYQVLKYIFGFLVKVMDRSDMNKMTASNLAIVFGPNLLWSRTQQASLQSLTNINHFTEFLLKSHDLIFEK